MTDFSGIFAPIPTAFDENENPALDHFESNLKIWAKSPLRGIVFPGSNSEAVYLSVEEKETLWQIAVAEMKSANKMVIAGAGMERTSNVISLCQKAGALGADAVLVLPPNYYKKLMTDEVLIQHYRTVADESPLPVLIYNIPANTGIDLSLNVLLNLADHPNIVGMKDSSSNVLKSGTLIHLRPDFQVLAGTGGAVLPFLSIGGRGGIMALANFAMQPLDELYRAFQDGKLEEARKIQLSLMQINTAVTAGYGVPGLKFVMDQLGMYGGPCCKPLLPLLAAAQDEIKGLLEKLNL